MNLTHQALTEENWKDFRQLFGKHKGVRGGCWCSFYLAYASEYAKLDRDDRYAHHKVAVEKHGPTGILLYDGDLPVGWAQVAKGDVLKRLNRNREYKKLNRPSPETIWRISCVFVDKDHRKKGIAKQAVLQAIEYARKQGGGLMEVAPFDFEGGDPKRFHHNGSVAFYEELGFKKVTRLGKNEVLMEKQLDETTMTN